MNISKDWVVTELEEDYIAVPVGQNASDFNGIVKMNRIGKEIWDRLSDGLSEEQIAKSFIEKYNGLSYEKALSDVQRITKELQAEGFFKE